MNVETQRIAIMTKSNKALHNGGHGCGIAGITATGAWIRLVSDKAGDSISEAEAKSIQLRCVLEAKIIHAPLAHQIENAVLCSYKMTQESSKQFIRNLTKVNEIGIFGNIDCRLSLSEANQTTGTLV